MNEQGFRDNLARMAVVKTIVKEEKTRLRWMIRGTTRTILRSAKLLQQTRELLKQSEAHRDFRINMPDNYSDQSTR